MHDNLKITIIGGNHHNTLGVIRALGEAKVKNIKLLLISEKAKKHCFVARSKYLNINNVCVLKSEKFIVEWLLNNREQAYKRIVICCSDASSEEVISHYESLKQFYYLPSSSNNIHELMTKSFQGEIAEKCGLNIPFSRTISNCNKNNWDSFPCILKPLKSTIGSGKSDIRICYSADEFKEALSTISADNIQAQSFIDKSLEYQLIGCSINAGKEIIIPGYTSIIRQPNNTNTGYLKYSPINNFLFDSVSVEKFIREIGYSGLFSMEFIRDNHGVDYFLEINLRNDGNAYCVKSAGVNLPLIWALAETGNDYEKQKKTIDKAIYFMPEFTDFRLGIKKVGFFKWLIQFFGSKSHAIFNLKDLRPFNLELRSRLKRKRL